MDVATWLHALGLGEYEAAFRENGVDGDVLLSLTADDLREIGVGAVGHRRKLLDAIAAFGRSASDQMASRAVDKARAVAAQQEAGGAERRQLTVLFCDLVGSTALSSRLDPEDLRDVMGAYHRVVTEAVRAQGGYVAKLLGDGVLAYFGWPQAHEDDAERAVRAGMAAVTAVTKLDVDNGHPLAARVGLSTGPVVVGEVLGEGEARERGVIGETPNLAARLQAAAAPHAVVADDATRRLTGGLFAWDDANVGTLRGFAGPVRAWRALGESGVESRFEALREGHTAPLVGREEELEMLLRRWRRARGGEGQVVLLRGEAGIGKSRLAAAVREAVGQDGCEELLFFCSPQHADSALHPVIGRLERAAGFRPDDVPSLRFSKLRETLLPLNPPPGDIELIAELLSVPLPDAGRVLDLSPQARRARLLEALLRRVRALAARRPVLALLEDAHWLDPTTRELLELLVTEAPRLPLLLVITHRPEFDAHSWLGQPHVTPLQMNRLGRAEHLAFLRHVAGGKPLPAEVEAAVLARTDGVPLFVEEVTRSVLEGGLLREEADRWALEGELPELAVPGSLQASLVARLDRLSSVREVAQAGAVLGREFAYDLLAAVSDLPEVPLRTALDVLAASDLIQRRGEPPEATYTFRHALIRDAAESTLLRSRRRDLHARAADAIGRMRPDAAERQPEVLAGHHAEAGDAEVAIGLYRRAGEQAGMRAAFREARAHLARGLELLPAVPTEDARQLLEAGLQVALGNLAMASEGQGSPEVGRAFARAVALGRWLGDDAILAPALWGLWGYKLFAGDVTGSLPVAEEAAALARRRPDDGQVSRAFAALGLSLYTLGRFQAARTILEEAGAVQDADDPGTGPVSGGSAAQAGLARLLAPLGALEQATAHARGAVARARRSGHLMSIANTLAVCCSVPYAARTHEPLRELAAELSDIARTHGYPAYEVRARCYLARKIHGPSSKRFAAVVMLAAWLCGRAGSAPILLIDVGVRIAGLAGCDEGLEWSSCPVAQQARRGRRSRMRRKIA